nr:ScpA family protein [Treponema pallidum]
MDESPVPVQEFKLSQFEGPLDLLLFLIKKNELSICDIPICEITAQYLQYVDQTVSPDLRGLTEFYAMAAVLLYIKSCMLLPMELDLDGEDIEDPRQSLVERLIEYQKYKQLCKLMELYECEDMWCVERKKTQHLFLSPAEVPLLHGDVRDLLMLFTRLVRKTPQWIMDLYEEVSVNEKLTLLSELLGVRGRCVFTELIKQPSRADVVCAFVAILEAAKTHLVHISQPEFFGPITLYAREVSPKVQDVCHA